MAEVEVTIGNAVFKLEGDSIEELDGELEVLEAASGRIFDRVATIQQVALGKGVMSGGPPAGATAKAAATGGSKPGKPADCQHGEWTWQEGVNKKTGAPYAGWYCAGRYPNNCKPVKA